MYWDIGRKKTTSWWTLIVNSAGFKSCSWSALQMFYVGGGNTGHIFFRPQKSTSITACKQQLVCVGECSTGHFWLSESIFLMLFFLSKEELVFSKMFTAFSRSRWISAAYPFQKVWLFLTKDEFKVKFMSCNHVKRGPLQSSVPLAACRRQRSQNSLTESVVTFWWIEKPLNPSLNSTKWWVLAGFSPIIVGVLISWSVLGHGGIPLTLVSPNVS